MPRCGCAEGTCSCNFAAGNGILITGNGRRGNPLTIGVREDVLGPGPEPVFGGELWTTDTQFGVLGSGDDAPVLNNWITALVAGSVFGRMLGRAPTRDYILGSAVAKAGLSGARFGIAGDGPDLTRFIVPDTNTAGGFLFDATGSPRDAQALFKDFSIITRGVGQGVGLQFKMSLGGANHMRSVRLEHLDIHGDNIATDCFDVFVDLTGCQRPYVNDVIANGPWGPGVSGRTDDANPQYVATAGLVLDGCYEPYVNACHIWGAYTLIRSVGTTEEAGRIANCQLVAGRVGIEWHRTGREPHLQIEGNHLNCRDDALDIKGVKILFINRNHFYNTDNDAEFLGIPRDVLLENVESVMVTDNFFWFDGHPDRIHVHAVNSASFGDAITISRNHFAAVGENAVLISTGATNVLVEDNTYTGTYVKPVKDNSGMAVIRDMVAGVYRVTNQNNGAGAGPVQEWYRDSTSAAANDLLVRHSMLGNDSAGNPTEYAAMQAKVISPTNGAESGAVQFYTMVAGTLVEAFTISPPAAGETALHVVRNHAGVYTVQIVTEGAVDTGGSGYRVLRVPN